MNKIVHVPHQDIRRYSTDPRVIKYTLVGSILKTHFKELMKMSDCSYHGGKKKGLIRQSNKRKFLDLVERINKISDERAAASHAKTAAESAQRNARRNEERNVRRRESSDKALNYPRDPRSCEHEDLGSLGYGASYGEKVICPYCGSLVEVW